MKAYHVFMYIPRGLVEGWNYKRDSLDSILNTPPQTRNWVEDPQNYFAVVGDIVYSISHPIKFVKGTVKSGRELFDILMQYEKRR